ncbi:MAG: terminase small subunit [Anaerocolumna sp.]|jgi:phage terminase small subunit|nr:terminase small subunit [Anaerocolumna sp.]
MALTEKQKRFIDEYLVDLNATAAYKRAYNVTNDNTAKVNGSRLLTKADIREIVDKRKADRAKDTGITANYVLTSLKNIADKCMTAEPVTDREGNSTGEYRFDSSGANRALELLGKHLKLFTDKIETENTTVIFNGEDNLED